MRLINCHIENFGKLSDTTISFQDGLNVIMEDNGWGKSTLATFLKVMLYGFSNDKKRDETENERKKYKPWQGGVYGGQLTFEQDGKQFRINRTFGKKELEDTFTIKDLATNLETKQFTSKVGEELFFIDSESFLRTVCVSQNDCETSVTDSINAKIGNLTDNTNDISNYDAVNIRLGDALNKLSPTRKTGVLSGMRDEIGALEASVRKGNQIDNAIKELTELKEKKHAELKEVQQKKDQLQEISEKLSIEKDIQVKRQQYTDLCKAVEHRAQEEKQIEKAFPNGLPKMEEINTLLQSCEKLPVYKQEIETNAPGEDDRDNLRKLSDIFLQQIPSEQDICHMEDNVKDLAGKKVALLRQQLTESENARYIHYKEQFVNGIPKHEQIDTISIAWRQRTEKKGTLSASKAALQTMRTMDAAARKQNSKKSNTTSLLLILFGILFLILGIVGFGMNLTAGILGFFVGLILVIIGFVLMITRKPIVAEISEIDDILHLEAEIVDKEDFISHTESQMRDFCDRYGIAYEEDLMQDALYALRSNCMDYEELRQRKDALDSGNTEISYQKECDQIKQFIVTYLPHVPNASEDSFSGYLYTIRMNVAKYQHLLEQKKRYEEAQVAFDKIKNTATAFIEKFSMEVESDFQRQLQDMKEILKEWEKADKEFQLAKKNQYHFEESNPDYKSYLQTTLPDNLPTLSELNEERNHLIQYGEEILKSIHSYDRQLESLMEESDQISTDEELLQNKREEYCELSEKYRHICLVQQYLKTAKENFTAKYMSPIMTSFSKYYTMLCKVEKPNYHVDANFHFTLDECGDEHELKLLSTGYRDLTGICIRMALVEAMYEKEVPFLLFDDPFVNLDKEKIEGGMELLGEISKHYQVIYFTCHESRK